MLMLQIHCNAILRVCFRIISQVGLCIDRFFPQLGTAALSF